MMEYYFIVDSRNGRIDTVVPSYNQTMDPPYVQILATDQYVELAKKIYQMELRASNYQIDLEKSVLTIISKEEALSSVDPFYNHYVEIPYATLDMKMSNGLELRFGNEPGSRYLDLICHEGLEFISRIKESEINIYATAPNDINFLYEQFCFKIKDFENSNRIRTSVNLIPNKILYNRDFTLYYRKKFSIALYKLL